MGKLLLLLFIAVPAVEIALFIQVGGWIGTWPTLGLILATAIIGSVLLRRQGMAMVMTIRDKLNRGEAPRAELVEGVVLVIAGAFLLTPGFFTDTVGFLLLVPPLRQWAARRALAMVDTRTGTVRRDADVIDVDDYIVTETAPRGAAHNTEKPAAPRISKSSSPWRKSTGPDR
jgi:UPF0716 protein FxsA